MNEILHATFREPNDGVRAAKAMLHHGVRPEDVNLILPESKGAESKRADADLKTAAASHDARQAILTKSAHKAVRTATAESGESLPHLPSLPEHGKPRHHGDVDVYAPHAPGYRFDALGAVIPDEPRPKAGAAQDTSSHEMAADAGELAGFGLVAGMAAAMCVPGVGTIAGLGAIAAGLMAAGTAAGGIAGGIYGYLRDYGVPHHAAKAISDHLAAGRATLSVEMSGTVTEAEIMRLIKENGGQLIRQA